ncbi:MAG: hypothetical protein GX564_14020 [Oligosphaeraceae bacterium]|nr:hypothetical protein [Oligosphaeraceae bacterium]
MHKRCWWTILLAIVPGLFLLIRISSWWTAEFWLDEAASLHYFCLGEGATFGNIFRNYEYANNHILFTAITWLWIRLFPNGAEWLWRLPALCCYGLAIILVGTVWRRWLGNRMAFLAALSLAVSPVCSAFAWQLRGYSLSMLLAVLAFTGLQFYLQGQTRRGQILLCLAALAQPLTMPSAALLTFAFAGSMAVLLLLRGWPGKKIALACSPMLLLTLLGAGYYLTLGEQLARAASNAASIAALRWNAWLVARHLCLAMLVHLGFLLFLLAQRRPERSCNPGENGEKSCRWRISPGLAIMGSSSGCILAVLLLSLGRQVPFPRNFLLFFPVFTLATALLLREQAGVRRFPFWKAVLGVLGFAWLSEYCCQQLMVRELRTADIRPHNLLYQYYRGMSDNRTIVTGLAKGSFSAATHVALVSNNDMHTAFWYWRRCGLPEESLYSLNEWRRSDAARQHRQKIILCWARHNQEAQELLAPAGRQVPLQAVQEFPRRTLYVVSMPP